MLSFLWNPLSSFSCVLARHLHPAALQNLLIPMSSSSTHKAALQNLRRPPDVHIVFYNPGIQDTQVQLWKLYNHWLLRKLRIDIVEALFQHKADISALSELVVVNTGLGRILWTWKESKKSAQRKSLASCRRYASWACWYGGSSSS